MFRTVFASKAVAAAGNYSAGDILSESASNGVGTAWEFKNIVESGKSGRIVSGFLTCSAGAVAVGYKLHLFKDNPSSSELDDNAALNIAAADQASYIGLLIFEAAADRGDVASARSIITSMPIGFICKNNILYGILEDPTGETGEVAGMTVTIYLTAETEQG